MNRIILVTVLGFILAPGRLGAQQEVKPWIMVVFDTSGSMTYTPVADPEQPTCPDQIHTCCFGDGSEEYPGEDIDGNGLFDDSRMAQLKTALVSLIVTTSSVEFGLARYYQAEGEGINIFEDWYPGPINYDGSENCQRGGQVLVSIGPRNEGEILMWMDGHEEWEANKELRADGSTPIAGTLEDVGAYMAQEVAEDPYRECRPLFVLLLTDGEESCHGDPVQAVRDLRTLTDAGGGVRDVRTFVVGFGEGVEGSSTLDTMAVEGGTAVEGHAFYASGQTELASVLHDVIAKAIPHEECNGLDDDCDGLVDDGLSRNCENECGRGKETCQMGEWGACSAPQPIDEVCDGLDNDCNGEVDEGLARSCETACGTGQEFCMGGEWMGCTAPAVTLEVCDGRDNDCDGQIDEDVTRSCTTSCGAGTQTCVDGAYGECQGEQPTEEVCDGWDNDCDGMVDEEITRPCSTECGEGVETCHLGVWTQCSAELPALEVCDGLDNDCDGQMDEDLSRPCENACGEGVETCIDGSYQGCTAPQGTEEVCDGQDNDCDGAIDEEVFRPCSSPCGRGEERCMEGEWMGCTAREPEEEVCDGFDNDCDGEVDEGVANACGTCGPLPQDECDGLDNDCDGEVDEDPCPEPGWDCVLAECAPTCLSGECFTPGRICTAVTSLEGVEYCLTPLCGDGCGPGRECMDLVRCVEEGCAALACGEGQVCSAGACVDLDCYVLGCPQGQMCVAGSCQPDPCAHQTCGEGQFCSEGECIKSCAAVTCPEGFDCHWGDCFPDPCFGVSCDQGQSCVEGACEADPCLGVACPEGRVCLAGECSQDDPCLVVSCSEGETCLEGECWALGAVDGGVSAPDASVPAEDIPAGQDGDEADAGQGSTEDGGLSSDGSLNDNDNEGKGCGCTLEGSHAPQGGALVGLLGLLGLGLLRRPRRALWALALCLPLLGGCSDDQTPVADAAVEDGVEPGDVGVFEDMAEPDSAPEPEEVCDGVDNDGDGEIDEGFDLASDVSHCGGCGNVCALDNANFACKNSRCIMTSCHSGYMDNDGDVTNGCEVECEPTAGGEEVCDDWDNDCDGLVDEGFDLQTDPDHCGSCDIACTYLHAAGLCVEGECRMGDCLPGFRDTNGEVEDGCEIPCEGEPQEEACDGLDNDCDGEIDEDFDLLTSLDHCGACNQPCHPPHAVGECFGGTCAIAQCEAGFQDLDREVDNGCENICTATGDEICDTLDNDCDGMVNEDLPVPPDVFCINVGVCAGVQAACLPDTGAWACPYPDSYQAEETLCDGLDNDCDGQTDEGHPDLGTTCEVGEGACTREGHLACAEDGLSLFCDGTPGEPLDHELCNGIDDDCDGEVDEDASRWTTIPAAGGSFRIFTYEASHPGATAEGADPLHLSTHACSVAGVMPWARLTREEARLACEALGEGVHLCTPEQWLRACEGPDGAIFPYGMDYVPDACNGRGNDADPSTPAMDDFLMPTGAKESCLSAEGVSDLCGNLSEWILDEAVPTVIRGGNYDSIYYTGLPSPLQCAFEGSVELPSSVQEYVGFRCCSEE